MSPQSNVPRGHGMNSPSVGIEQLQAYKMNIGKRKAPVNTVG